MEANTVAIGTEAAIHTVMRQSVEFESLMVLLSDYASTKGVKFYWDGSRALLGYRNESDYETYERIYPAVEALLSMIEIFDTKKKV